MTTNLFKEIVYVKNGNYIVNIADRALKLEELHPMANEAISQISALVECNNRLQANRWKGGLPVKYEYYMTLLERIYNHSSMTFWHSLFVGLYAKYMLDSLLSSSKVRSALSDADQELLEQIDNDYEMYEKYIYTIILHDVGKLLIPKEILEGGKATEKQLELIRTHPQKGYEILYGYADQNKSNSEMIYGIVTQHHERYNGTGYPKNLEGKELSLWGRIVAIADSFEAMIINPLTYRKYLSIDKQTRTLDSVDSDILNNQGRLYDPALKQMYLMFSRIYRIKANSSYEKEAVDFVKLYYC